MPSPQNFASFPDTAGRSLGSLSGALYQQQQTIWPMLADGVAALDAVQFRTIDCGPFSVRVQWNPKRIVSTGANVSAAAIRERKCFLCVAHLPAEQQGVLWNDEFLVLCNPMPIFREHFTVSHVQHIPQSIEERILPFLRLAKDFAPHYSVFYNGPKCGASAPDHMHFQASPAGLIPAEREVLERRRVISTVGGVTVSTAEEYGRSVIMLEGEKEQAMELAFLRTVAAMRAVTPTNDEPMMNVLGTFADGRYRIIIFVRSKHRPDAYFRDGDEKVLISPASVDIGGLVVTPLEKDFRQADAALLTGIFREVSVPPATLHDILQRI